MLFRSIVYVDQPHQTGHVLLFDAHGAGYAATRHLREHGHDRIGIVTAPLSWPNVREVYEGYAQALEDADGRLSRLRELERDEIVGRGGPRQVGYVMAKFGGGVPWWRVVRADGRPARNLEERGLRLLRADQTPIKGDRVDMARARYIGDEAHG